MQLKTVLKSTVVLCLGFELLGCGATSALINHSSLDVSSKMSDSIFLDPLPTNQQTVLIQVRNTTNENLKGISAELASSFSNAGWKVVKDKAAAYNIVQVNVLQAGKADDPDAVWKSVQSGYGAVAFGGLAGLATMYSGGSMMTSLGVGAAVGIASWATDKLVTNVAYSVVTDVQISTRTSGKVSNSTHGSLKQGRSTYEHQDYSATGNLLKYQTRIGTVAQKVNLKFVDAKPVIVSKLSQEIVGIFVNDE